MHTIYKAKLILALCTYESKLPGGLSITPHRWVPITPITSLFERAVDLYKTHHFWENFAKTRKSLENFGKFLKIGENFWEKVDFNEGGRVRHLPL